MTTTEMCEAGGRLVDTWLNGNKSDVQAEVAKMHPLVAAYIVTQMALAMGLMEAIEFTEWLGHRAEEAK